MPRGDGWYLKVSVSVKYEPTTAKSVAERVLSGAPVGVLAVDRGIRDPITFAHLVFGEGCHELRGDRRSRDVLPFGVVEAGPLEDAHRTSPDPDGVTHTVDVLADGFAWNGAKFRSLSAIAKAITGTNWNGHAFFGLTAPKKAPRAAKSEEVDE